MNAIKRNERTTHMNPVVPTGFVEARLTILVPQKIVPKEVCQECGKTAKCCILVFEVMYEKTDSRKVCEECLFRLRKNFEKNANRLVSQSALDFFEKVNKMNVSIK